MGGNLIFDVAGVISGKGGAANSGVGGDAFQANRVGNANQKLILNLQSGAVLRGGGGGAVRAEQAAAVRLRPPCVNLPPAGHRDTPMAATGWL
ncbi:hypothetical protein AWN88_25650 [Agrobacterium tumefaciens]|nr:hypothetical protein AWN88_25650 [Agrobacterium tumefaciens]